MKKRIVLLMCACALACSMSTWSQAAGTSGKVGKTGTPRINKVEPASYPQLKPLTNEQWLENQRYTKQHCRDLSDEILRTCPDSRNADRCNRAVYKLKMLQRGGGCR